MAVTLTWHVTAKRTANYHLYGAALADLPEDARMGCENAFGNAVPRECDFGDTSSDTVVVLFGDSHIEQWLPAMHQIADRRHWKIALLVKSACSAFAMDMWNESSGESDASCALWRTRALKQIARLHPRMVMVSSFSGYTQRGKPNTLLTDTEWTDGARSTFGELSRVNIPVVFLHDTPWARFEVTQCLSRDAWLGTHHCVPLRRAAALNEAVYHAIEQGAKGTGAAFVDMTDNICTASECDLVRGNVVVYRDAGHLTATFLRSLSPALEQRILKVVPALAPS